MNRLRANWHWIVLGVGAAIIAALSISALSDTSPQKWDRFRCCGHRRSISVRLQFAFPRLQRFGGREANLRLMEYLGHHGCSGNRAHDVLTQVHFAQRKFLAQTGRYAESLSDLAPPQPEAQPTNGPTLPFGFRIDYEVSQKTWSACIPRQADLPGHYLVNSTAIYFNENRRPTTNDAVLAFF